MKIALFGASRGTGLMILAKALDAGYEVRALVRSVPRSWVVHPDLATISGDARDPERVAKTVAGADCVVSAVGPVRGDAPGLMHSFAGNLIAAMQTQHVHRLIYMSGAGVLQPEDPPALVPKIMLPLMKLLAREVLEDSVAGVERIKSSALEWTIVRAPRLADAPARREYRVGYIKPRFEAMSRADVADFVLKQLASREYLRKLPIVSY